MEAEQSEEITILVLLNLVSSELAHLLCIVGIIMSPVNDMSQMPALGDPVSSPQVIDLIAEGDAAAEELYGPFKEKTKSSIILKLDSWTSKLKFSDNV